MPTDPKCPACGDSSVVQLDAYPTESIYKGYDLPNPQVISSLKALHPIDRYRMFKCATCGLEFAAPLASPSEAWYGLLYKNLRLYPGMRWEYAFVLKNTLPGSSICDLGCGSGEFLRVAMGAGLVAAGFDFSLDAVADGKADGLEIHHLDLTGPQSAEIREHNTIVSFQVLEHLESPVDLFIAANALGTCDCQLWISVPSYLRPSRIYSEVDYLDLPPHHMTHWTPESLKSLGERSGWTLRQLHYEPIPFKQVIWNRSVRTRVYKYIGTRLKHRKWLERFLRAVLFAPVGIHAVMTKQQISGFSMLAQFERKTNG